MIKDYNLLLKSYQLKDILTSSSVTFSTDECIGLMSNNFLQSVSKIIRKEKENIIKEENKFIEIILFAITHKDLLFKLDNYSRKINLIEKFTAEELVESSNVGLTIIEYLSSIILLLQFSEKDHSQGNLKKEFLNLTLPSEGESIFLNTGIERKIEEELNILFTSAVKIIKNPVKSEELFKKIFTLIKENTVYISIPEKLKFIDYLLQQNLKDSFFIEELRNKFPQIILEIKKEIKTIISYMDEQILEDKKSVLFIFSKFYIAFNLLLLSFIEIEEYIKNRDELHILTSLQLQSLSREYFTLMIYKNEGIFKRTNNNYLRESLSLMNSKKFEKNKFISIIEEIMNKLYLKEEKITEKGITTISIEECKKAISLIEEENMSTIKFLEGLVLLLRVNNRTNK